MKTRFSIKVIAVFLALVFLHGIFAPTALYALTGGMHQAEYTDYETNGSTDLVNLATGDLTYTQPLIHVPGPMGGFSMPLSYHAGIMPEQEASWVGLGWSLNPGAIIRHINQYPDDASGEAKASTAIGEGPHGHSTTILVYTHSYNSLKGTGGMVSLGFASYGWGSIKGIQVLGISDDGSVDPIGVATGVVSLLTLGAGGWTVGGAIGLGEGTMAALGVANTVIGVSSAAYAAMQAGRTVSNINDWQLITNSKFFLLGGTNTWEVSLNSVTEENMFGSLYLAGASSYSRDSESFTIKYGDNSSAKPLKFFSKAITSYFPCSDVHVNVGNVPAFTVEPSSIAYDGYSVMGAGISGVISPYRTDVGSMALPLSEDGHTRFNPIPVLKNKVNFIYKGEASNYYKHHIGKNANDQNNLLFDSPSANVGFELRNTGRLDFAVTDPTLYQSSQRTESERIGLNQKQHLAGSKHIDWYSNRDIIDGKAVGFIDDPTIDRENFPEHGIGGYSIVRSDGMTYHYALPVYNSRQYSHSQFKVLQGKEYTTGTNNDEINEPFATTWLLTAITGPDYIDRSKDGEANSIIDEHDWGYYVQFEYGRFNDNYNWRTPYQGFNYSPAGTNYKQFVGGTRETYYLNTISTATHTAIFIKNVRTDGKGVRQGRIINDPVSLRLEQIILLRNADYQELIKPTTEGGIYAFRTNSDNLALESKVRSPSDHLSNVFDIADLDNSAPGDINKFLQQKQLKRIRLTYNYELCKNTPNSYEFSAESVKLGKLTLDRVSIYGKEDTKIMPDYVFGYGDNDPDANPDYDKEKFDGWGMYSPLGKYNSSTHNASSDGDQWSLRKVTTPTGASVSWELERDTYRSISNRFSAVHGQVVSPALAPSTSYLHIPNGQAVASSCFQAGQKLSLTLRSSSGRVETGFPVTVEDVGPLNKKIYISDPKTLSHYNGWHFYIEGQIDCEVYGGNLRTKSVVTIDEKGNEYRTEYIYTDDSSVSGKSSGVCAKEPPFIKAVSSEHDPFFYRLYDYTSTPVLYSTVTVLSGKLTDASDNIAKSVYNFETPYVNLVKSNHGNTLAEKKSAHDGIYDVKINNFNLAVYTSRIGRINSIATHNAAGRLNRKIDYNYLDNISEIPGNIGVFTEGSIMCDQHRDNVIPRQIKFIRTTKISYPNILQSYTITDNTGTKTIRNETFDPITGTILETTFENAYGQEYKTKIIPAYKKYDAMGFKIDNPANKHMISQQTAEYLYTRDGSGNWKEIDAEVQTWNNQWTYREYDETNDNYKDELTTDIWRKHRSYVWKSAVNNDGIFSTFTDFDWNGTPNSGWQMAEEVTRYDHFSNPIEVKDINGDFAATKLGYSEMYPIASAGNVNYRSFTYTGFENIYEPEAGVKFFDGEVDPNNSNVVLNKDIKAHTGLYVAKVPANTSEGPAYAVEYDGSESNLESGRTYRASVWVHKDSPDEAEIILQLTGTCTGGCPSAENMRRDDAEAIQAGDWYLLYVNITVPDAANLTDEVLKVYLKNSSTTTDAYFDDLRLHPVDAPITCMVYDHQTGQATAVLDNENFATKYYYDNAGRLIKVERETTEGGFKTVSKYQQNFARPLE